MNIGGKYNWKNQPEREILYYIGKNGRWHQFVKVASPGRVAYKVLDEHLHMIEETK